MTTTLETTDVDLLVIGADAAGMTAALVASREGTEALLCENTERVGGITAISAGTVWVPGTSQSIRAGVPDSLDEARRYLASIIGSRGGDQQREAFLEAGPDVIDYLESRTDVQFDVPKAHPDYLSNHDGAAFAGRALGARPFDGRNLGGEFDRVLPPWPEFLVLGGMMVTRLDIPHLLAPFSSLCSLRHVVGLVFRYAMDRLRYRRGTRW